MYVKCLASFVFAFQKKERDFASNIKTILVIEKVSVYYIGKINIRGNKVECVFQR
jgi:hypothetical protein